MAFVESVETWIESFCIDALFFYNRTKIQMLRLLASPNSRSMPESSVSIYYTDMKNLVEVGNVKYRTHCNDDFLGEIESCIIASNTAISLDGRKDVIVIAKQYPWYMILSPESPIPKTIPPRKSHVEFFVVQYMNRGKTVQLHIPNQMLYVDNVLFTPTFVLWLLRNEMDEDYVFDENYVLTIMDQNIEEIHLTSEQYLVLGEDDYEVKRKNM